MPPLYPTMDGDYILDYPSDHHELTLTAADIEAIGSGYAAPPPPPPSDVPQVPDHNLQQEQGDNHDAPDDIDHELNELDHGYDDGDFLPEPHYNIEEQAGDENLEGDETDEPGPSRRGNGRARGNAGLTEDEKKQKQREANKRAAERSRAKRRKDLDSTEGQVTQLRRENERLRARLASLRNQAHPASPSEPYPGQNEMTQPGPSSRRTRSASRSASPSTLDPKDTGIDRAYVHKLAVELVNAKSALLDKNIELAQLRGKEGSEAVQTLRQELVNKYATISALRAEDSAMSAVLKLLSNETIELGARRRAIEAEVKKRGGALAGQQGEGVQVQVPPEVDEAREAELKRTQEEEAASHTQVLAQAVRDVAMGGAQGMEGHAEENGVEKDVYDIQPYIEQVMDDWQHSEDRM